MNAWIWIVYPVWCMAMASISCYVTQHICPSAVGGGLPEVKTILSGTVKPSLLSRDLILAKLLGLLFACIAGLSVGKEGPFVHISAAVADQIMNLPLFR